MLPRAPMTILPPARWPERSRSVKPSDAILFGKYTSQEIKLDGEDYLIMRVRWTELTLTALARLLIPRPP
jgi:hypothetical protein